MRFAVETAVPQGFCFNSAHISKMTPNSNNKLLLTVTGPTAVGKTSLAVEIAQKLNTEIISCDSRQVYKEMRIGTAVPELEHLQAIPHHFIQFRSVEEPLNANDFGILAREKLTQLFEKHNVVVMVGGSGLYIDSVLKGIDNIPSPDPSIREQIQQQITNGELLKLQSELKSVDPTYYEQIDIQNPRRIMRGLEVYRTCGTPISQFLTNKSERDFQAATIVLELDRNELYDKINRRVDIMVEEGLIKEAEYLFPFRDLSSLQTVGYQELFSYFKGEISLEEAIQRIKNNSRQYARKQETWFRRYDSAFRINALQKKGTFKLVREICF